MTGEQIAFFVIATVTVLAALGMVGVASVFHAALLMVLAFVGIASLYILLGAGFLGVVQILIYVGAIAVLMIFAIMLTPRVMQQGNQSRFTRQWPYAGALAATLVILLVPLLISMPWPVVDAELLPREYAVDIGLAFMAWERTALNGVGGYLLPFEVASVLLLVALVGAIVIAREEP